jgi:ATP-dependent helicase HrpB
LPPVLSPLPIDTLLPHILDTLRGTPNLIVCASPGSGKTTRIPPALLTLPGLPAEKEILVLVPRRLAAKMASRRVAEEMGEEVGQTVGYQFRFERVAGPRTRLKFLTEGMLFRHLIAAPLLPHAGIVILDEFHERHIHADVALAALRRLQLGPRPELKILIMSATLETRTLAAYLDGAPVLELATPTYPVTIHYRPAADKNRLEAAVTAAVKTAWNQASGTVQPAAGHVLVFLPGMVQIRRCAEALQAAWSDRALVLPLHGDLPRAAQDLIFAPSDRPKVILATNIAESSLTIAGVGTVIDSGLYRQASHSHWNGIPQLKTRPISRAAAIQRAGRAGRTGPGTCVRLYSQADLDGRPEFERPEIQRADLSQVLLEILAAGVKDVRTFPWLEPPPAGAVDAALELLTLLGAIRRENAHHEITVLGRRMAGLPLHPRLSRLLIAAEAGGVLTQGARLAAWISEGELKSLDASEDLRSHPLSEGARRLEEQLLRNLGAAPDPGAMASGDFLPALADAVLTGFPDRVAQKRGGGHEIELVFALGASARVENAPCLLQHEMFVVLEVRESSRQGESAGRTAVRSLVPIATEALLAGPLLRETDETVWDRQRLRVVRRSRLSYGRLTLSETQNPPNDPGKATQVFLQEALGLRTDGPRPLETAAILSALSHHVSIEGLETELARLALFLQHDGNGAEDGRSAVELLLQSLRGIFSLADLQNADLAGQVRDALPPAIRTRLEQALPTMLTLPSGRKAWIHYAANQPPWVESRLQDFFGMREAPVLMRGKIRLTLHLLAPNGRAVQVTNDLTGFWQKTYPELRPQLIRRYPKHKWPERP